MNRLSEIEKRLAEINEAISLEGADIDALTTETDSLLAERTAIMEENEKRTALLAKVAEGTIGTITEEINTMEEVRTYAVDSAEYRTAWLNGIRGVELSDEEKRAFTTSNGAIATKTANKIMDVVKNHAPILQYCDVIYSAEAMTYYVEGTNNAASDHTENAEISAAADTLAHISLNPAEITKLIQISAAATKMSVDAFEAWLSRHLGEAIAAKINAKIVGLFSTATSAGTGITAANLRALLGAVKGDVQLLCDQSTLFEGILPLQNDAQSNIVSFVGKDAFVYGRPVLVDDNVTTGTIYCANLSKVAVELAEDIAVKSAYDISTNSNKYLGYALMDCKLGYAGAVKKIVAEA